MIDNQIIDFSNIISKYRTDDFIKADKITTTWKRIVSGIKSNKFDSEYSETRMPLGERLANNTRVIELKNGVLLVEADHSGWIQYLRMYQKYILNGLKMYLPELKISSLAFRLTGTDISLKDVYEEQVICSKKEFEEKINKQEKEAEKLMHKRNDENDKTFDTTLPPELVAKLEGIMKSMLTNSEE